MEFQLLSFRLDENYFGIDIKEGQGDHEAHADYQAPHPLPHF